jgi:hypothetical protein
LSQTNESATVPKTFHFSELNEALEPFEPEESVDYMHELELKK